MNMKPKFTIDGGTFESEPESAKAIRKLLDSLPLGALLSRDAVAKRSGVSSIHTDRVLRGHFSEQRIRHGAKFIYGSKKTIAALAKQKDTV